MKRVLKAFGLFFFTLCLMLMSGKAWAEDEAGVQIKAEGFSELLAVYAMRKQIHAVLENRRKETEWWTTLDSVQRIEKEMGSMKATLKVVEGQVLPIEVGWVDGDGGMKRRVVNVSKEVMAEYVKSPPFIASLYVREVIVSEREAMDPKKAVKAGVVAQAHYLKKAMEIRKSEDERVKELLAAYEKGTESAEFGELVTSAEKGSYVARKEVSDAEMEENLKGLDELLRKYGMRLIEKGKK